ncbi:hypothetical protein SAMN05444000_10764 [Shimia gijangensis]|uniref:Uncharacterized protein n=1 Tax=Shimia gijangensis TaxID=1470563 RepID=A0A1M6ICG0_9RHOB|nr:hypothetical protein [Shimia gijangensis]SHJ32114.1 hypothetical protein SAMN05444000_10764 [Shimia gijangensis]
MKTIFSALLVAILLLHAAPAPAVAGTLSNACMKSDRKAKSRKLCRCLQNVANQNLSRRDQKLAASFFKDPHKAQEIRQSDNRSNEKFWKRYKEFGSVFAASCSHL